MRGRADRLTTRNTDLNKPLLLFITLAMLGTQGPSAISQSLPPVRQLGRIVSKSAQAVPGITGARELPHGKVLVNDTVSRRLYLFDSALTSRMVVLDSTEGAENFYGDSPGGMISYRGDSTLFAG